MQPGAYRLVSNLVVPNANTTAIEIKTDYVVIDLNGFSILGPTVCPLAPVTQTSPPEVPVTSCNNTGTGIGIKAADPTLQTSSTGPVANDFSTITVKNGTVAGMGSIGIVLGHAARIENVTVRSNGDTGIMTGRGSIIRDNIAIGNGKLGFYIGNSGNIRGNTATLNGSVGIEFFSGLVVDNTTIKNGSFGLVQGGESPHVFVNNAIQP